MATSFSPQTFLTNQGWAGPGSGLRKGSIKKPVTVAHKTNLKGIGKERDTGYAWWDDVFSMVANKKKGSETPELRKTSTGIHSPLPPGYLSSNASGTSTPVPVASTSSAGAAVFHTDIIGQAKLEATRREFYSKFMRGRSLIGTVADESEDEVEVEVEVEDVEMEVEVGGEVVVVEETVSSTSKEKKLSKEHRRLDKEERRRLRREKKDIKKKRKAEVHEDESLNGIDSASSNAPVTLAVSNEGVNESKSKNVKKRKHRELEVDAQDLENPSSLPSEPTELTKAEQKASRKVEKKQKKERRIVGGENTPDDAADSSSKNPSDTTQEVEDDSKAAKKARKEEKRRRKLEKGERSA